MPRRVQRLADLPLVSPCFFVICSDQLENGQGDRHGAAAIVEEGNPVSYIPYFNNASMSDMNQSVKSGLYIRTHSSTSSFYKLSHGHLDALVQDDVQDHPRSLVHLLPAHRSLAGVFEATMFHKVGLTFFPLHDEQCGMYFTHHQLQGSTFWFLLRVEQEQKIKKMARHLARLHRAASGHDEVSALGGEEQSCIALIRYHAKGIMPTIELLKKFRIEFDVVFLQGEQILHGRGPHFGIGVGAVTTSLASNQLHEPWLKSGIDHIERYMRWLCELADLADKLGDAFEDHLEQFGASRDVLQTALNQHPPDFLCALVSALASDPDGAKAQPELVTHKKALAGVANLRQRCDNISESLHSSEVSEFLLEYYVGDGRYKASGFHLCECLRYAAQQLMQRLCPTTRRHKMTLTLLLPVSFSDLFKTARARPKARRRRRVPLRRRKARATKASDPWISTTPLRLRSTSQSMPAQKKICN